MKKLLIISTATFILSAVGSAQTIETSLKSDIKDQKMEESRTKKQKREDKKELRKLEDNEVSFLAKEHFYRDFGDLPVTSWERTINYDKATFTKDGQVLTAYYDADAELIGTVSDKTFEDLPSNAQDHINVKYHEYTKGDVIFFNDNEFNETDMVLYNQPFEDADNYFVELEKDNKKIILEVNMNGDVSFFTQLK